MVSKQEFAKISNEMRLEIVKNRLLTDVKIDSTTFKMTFDTGASATSINDTTLLKNYSKLEKSMFGKSKLVNKKLSLAKISLSSSNELYSASNEVVTVLFAEKNPCNESVSKGLLGSSYFHQYGDKKILNLDFETLKAKILSDVEKNEMVVEYQEVKSKFFLHGTVIKLFMTINGIEEPFLFDTGNSAAPLVVGRESKIPFKNGLEFTGSLVVGADNSKSNDTNIFYNNVTVQMGSKIVESYVLYNSAYLGDHNNVGLPFAKNFNWILDYKNQKVYCKQISNDIVKEIKANYKYKVSNNKGKLFIIIKSISESTYNLGDEITSVNDVSITSENICEIEKLVNQTNDWTTLKLEVTPVQQN